MRVVQLTLALGLVAWRAAAAEELNDPAAELASFQLAEGFEANLYASEADGVVKPIQIRWDASGRLWVIESRTYPQIKPGETPDDKVLILEDTDHDGHVDKVTTFADHLLIPTGLEVDGDGHGAWVGEGTKLWHLRDTDGDDRADVREVVLRGFGTGDAHQDLNSFLWSPGGDLMFCQGLHADSHVETSYGLVSLGEAGFWRYRPGTRRLESFFGGKADPQNPWGWVFTEWGQPLLVAGNNGGIFFPLPEMVRGHDDRRAGNIWVDARARKTSGPDLVGTAHLPSAWQGTFITGGYINNAVWALKVSDDDAGFRVTDLPPLITSSHTSFRPVDVKIGPDGAIYLCDWYNPIIGHYQASFRHPDRDKEHGRIWRITAKGRPLVTPPLIAGASLPQLLENLRSPERWVRFQSKRVLGTQEPAAFAVALKEWMAQLDPQDPGTERALTEALGVCESLELPQPDLLQRLLHSTSPDAVAYAAGTVARWGAHLPDPLSLLKPLAADEHPRVRLAAVVAAVNLSLPSSLSLALRTLERPLDRFVESALHQAVVGLKPEWLPLLQHHELTLAPEAWAFLAKADGTADTLAVLREQLADPVTGREQRRPLLETLAEVGGPDDLALLLAPQNFSAAIGEKLAADFRVRKVKPSGDLAGVLPVQPSAPMELRLPALRLAGLYKEWPLLPAVLSAMSSSEPELVRLAAISGVAAFGGPKAAAALTTLATSSESPALRVAAIAGLAANDLPGAAALAGQYLSHPTEPESVGALLSAFLARSKGTEALSEALANQLPLPENAAAALQYLRGLGRQDQALVAALSQASSSKPALHATPEFVAALAAEVRSAGNAAHGEALFHSAQLACIACHSIGGQGGVIGPSLDAIGSGQPLDFIIGAVLEPQKEIKESFEALEVTTKDGRVLQGYRVREGGSELVLRDVAAGSETILRREQIAQKRELGSLMPSGLVDHLSREELRDLFRYLSEQGKPKR